MAPWWSTLTLMTELLVTAAVLATIYYGYVRGVFLKYLAGAALAYEVIFNISYMATRAFSSDPVSLAVASPFYIALAIFHGTFSLFMFAAILAFFAAAWRAYGRGENFFRVHRVMTMVFTACWLIALCSGFVFYYVSYLS